MITSTLDNPNMVDRLLAEFPGPLYLRASPSKWWPFIAAGPAIAALIAVVVISADLRHGHAPNEGDVTFAFVGLFIGLFVAGLGRKGLKGSLRLDVDGFRAISVMQKQYSWSEVTDFNTYGSRSGAQVVFDAKTERHDAGAVYWPGANTHQVDAQTTSGVKSFSGVPYKSMPDNYGLAADDLARLMNGWRQLAIQASARA